MTAGTNDGTGAGTTAGTITARRTTRTRVTAALLGGALAATLAACGGEAPAPSEGSPSSNPAPAGAWTYTASPDGSERTATLTGPDGTLEFRTSPGRPPSGTLELARADISCPPDCKFEVAVDDDEAPWSVTTDETPTSAASFADPGRLWRKFPDAQKLILSYPRGESAVGTATFDVSGVDPAALPGL